jgi:hypothetical protein
VTSQFLIAAASVAMLGAGIASVDGTRSAEVLPAFQANLADGAAGSGNKCRVDVIRLAAGAGNADITRQSLPDGGCVCTVTTGPSDVNGSAESIVSSLIRDKACDGAPAPGRTVAETAASGGGGSGVIIPAVVGTVGAAGLAVALGSDSKG